jgi:hypothetical protein
MPRILVPSVFGCDGAGLGGEAPRGACAPERAPSSNGATGAGRSLLLPDASRSHAAVEAVATALVLAASGHRADAPIADPEERSTARRVRVCGDEQGTNRPRSDTRFPP